MLVYTVRLQTRVMFAHVHACPCHDARQGWNSPEAGYPECFISTTLSSMVPP